MMRIFSSISWDSEWHKVARQVEEKSVKKGTDLFKNVRSFSLTSMMNPLEGMRCLVKGE